MLYAVIDIGTVTGRLYVAEIDDGEVKELLRRSEFLNLGVGVDETGYLQPEAIERTGKLMAEYLAQIEQLRKPGQELNLTAVATSASRDAENSQDLVDMLEDLGIHLSVIAGEQEAAYCFAGASAGRGDENLLVADIGGGSTELIAGRAGELPVHVHSFQLGCRRVTERFLHSDPPTAQELREARAWFEPQLATFFDRLEQSDFHIDRMIAVAGTATSTVSISKHMKVYDRTQVHNTYVSRETLDEVAALLASLPLEQRKQVVGLRPGRADVIVGGMIILQTVLDLAGTQGFTVSECDLLYGVVASALS